MDESTMSDALDAIHDVAQGLLKRDLPREVAEGLDLITSIARYKHDVRTEGEAAKAAPIEHKEEYERDGVNYEIIVEREEGRYWGRWNCPLCNEGGQSSKACSSIEDAVDAAITNIGPHPLMKHRKGAGS